MFRDEVDAGADILLILHKSDDSLPHRHQLDIADGVGAKVPRGEMDFAYRLLNVHLVPPLYGVSVLLFCGVTFDEHPLFERLLQGLDVIVGQIGCVLTNLLAEFQIHDARGNLTINHTMTLTTIDQTGSHPFHIWLLQWHSQ